MKKLIELTNSICDNSSTDRPNSIDQNHWEEWIKSSVNSTITSLNMSSFEDSVEVDKLLNRNNKSRWKHSDNLVPGWAVTGLDPLTDEPTLLGVQFKPDGKVLDKNGKHQKYINASQYNATPLFLRTGIDNFWRDIIEDKAIPVLLTEGAKKAGAGLSAGHATVSIPGVSSCRKKGRLHPWLILLCGYGRTFYLVFDNDLMTKKHVQIALLALGRELAATGSKIMIISIPDGDAKGMDDYLALNGADAFQELIDTAKTIEEWNELLKEAWLIEQERIKLTNKSKLARNLQLIKLGWGESLRFNCLKNQIEMHGEPIDLEQVRLRIALEFDIDVPAYDAISIIDILAKQQSYHPVQEYLEVKQRCSIQTRTPQLLTIWLPATLGQQKKLHNIYMRKTLIAAVARIFQPGCQHDAATIFIGKQYAGKSSFWRELFGRDFFSDQLGEATKSEDELAKVHQFWGLEWSEFETVYRKKDVAGLKKFMSAAVDAFRLPYARTTKEYPRQSILVGTSNEEEILNDPTGNRRFWIVPVLVESIPLDLLLEERDRIWAAAYHAYMSGEKWELKREDRLKQAELNKSYETQDPWQERIQDFLRGKIEVAVSDLFHHLGIEPSRQDVGFTKRISAILRRA